jgi:four helix bundle protein
MNAITSHKDLVAWQAAIALAARVYGATQALPSHERMSIASDLRQAAAAVPTLIAEGALGCNRSTFMHKLRLARGSLAQLETHLVIAGSYGLMTDVEDLLLQLTRVSMMVATLLRRLAEQRTSPNHFSAMGSGLTDARRPHPP